MKFKTKLRQLTLAATISSMAITIVPSEILGAEISQDNQNHSRPKRWSAENPHNVNESTHLWLAQDAINRLARDQDDIKQNAAAFLNTPEYKTSFEQGLYDADYLDEFNQGGTGKIYIDGYISGGWKPHFYDPHTGKNYKGETTPTARTEGTKYFELAGEYFKNKEWEKAFYFLGVSTHYFTDVTQPMHAANFTNFDLDNLNAVKFHSAFENYVTEIQDSYRLSDNILPDYNLVFGDDYEYSYDSGDWIHHAALIAKIEAPKIIRDEIFEQKYGHILSLSDFKIRLNNTWKQDLLIQEAIANSLMEAQRITPAFLNLWFEKFVGLTKPEDR